MTVEFLADVGHPEPPRSAIEQPDSEVGLELLDAVAECRLWNVESPASGGEATPVNHRHEIENVIQVEHVRLQSSIPLDAESDFLSLLANIPENESSA
jgi:hypothetical protein